MNKNFEKLHKYPSHVKGNFSIIALRDVVPVMTVMYPEFFGQTGTNIEPTLKVTFSKYVPPNAHKQVRKEIKREKQTFA